MAQVAERVEEAKAAKTVAVSKVAVREAAQSAVAVSAA